MKRTSGKFILTAMLILKDIDWPQNAEVVMMNKLGEIVFYKNTIELDYDKNDHNIVKTIHPSKTLSNITKQYLNKSLYRFYRTRLTRQQYAELYTHPTMQMILAIYDNKLEWPEGSKMVAQDRYGNLQYASRGLSPCGDRWVVTSSPLNFKVDQKLVDKIGNWKSTLIERELYNHLMELSS